MATSGSAVLLVSHGTVDSVDELPEFLKNIRHGRPAEDAVLAEVRRRYLAIGGKSPLNAISQRLAAKVGAILGVPARMAGRLWAPYPTPVLEELRSLGARRVAMVPLAQHSAKIYADAVQAPANDLGLELRAATNWGQTPRLLDAYAARVIRAVEALAPGARDGATIVFTAHSLPSFVVNAGDPYETEFRASVEAVRQRLPAGAPPSVVAFQSQGMSGPGPGGKPMTWLGPDLPTTLDELAAGGRTHVIVAPIGFLADHVEILYDLDIEATGWAKDRGLVLSRTESLDDSDDLAAAIADVAKPLLDK
jgi:ferrochelatase